jgi:hypothetical protein
MPSLPQLCRSSFLATLALATASQAQDLHLKKNISTGGYVVSTTETSIKGGRERSVTQTPNGSTITLHQCDLRRTLTLNEANQTYYAADDPQDENAAKAAALASGAALPEAQGGKITITTTVTDTGERKTLYGYQARHLKAKVVQEPSADACTQVRQSFEIDGWFADLSKEQASCGAIAPPVQQGTGCHDKLISRVVGSGKTGYPMQEDISLPSLDGGTTTVSIRVAEVSKQQLPTEMFDVPAGYRQVASFAELQGTGQNSIGQQLINSAPSYGPTPQMPQGRAQTAPNTNALAASMTAGMLNPMAAPAAQQNANAVMQQQLRMAQASGLGGMQRMMGGMPQTGAQPNAMAAPAPAPLGPKAPGKIRIGVAPPDAQVGQGNDAGADYSTPIRNAEIALMSGPAIEIAPLDSHLAVQLQAEAQQKQCDYILFSGVSVKHSSGGFGKFMKAGSIAASMTPMGAMAHGMRGAVAAQAAGAAASQIAQQQAMNQLAGFNGQIKSKDDVSVQYQLVATGQSTAVVQNALQGKAKSDGEDVLTPLLQQAATSVLDAVSPHK